ncbi:MAG TPA: RnfH family protein [Accumulibacter sp.]|uniref:RnfH family protein n=1 Tax=Accumulibacter sp. TaxID=2053492 RepID=UPI002B6A7BCF|nr:RnfH family protein [Accumulibacter sp.]HRD89782.1 RnfH family protein [Accumulibacter sp.]
MASGCGAWTSGLARQHRVDARRTGERTGNPKAPTGVYEPSANGVNPGGAPAESEARGVLPCRQGVACSDAGQQIWLTIEVPDESTVCQTIDRSGILKSFPTTDLQNAEGGW